MNDKLLAAAIAECRRFLDAATDYKCEVVTAEVNGEPIGNKLSAKVRRASLDLTRALADLRRR